MTTLTAVNTQWASRPADQRFLSLLDMQDHVEAIRRASRGAVVSSRSIQAAPAEDNVAKGLKLIGDAGVPYDLTHWSFGQVAGLAGAPAGYLRTLPAPLAADALNYGLRFARDAEDVGLLLTKQEGVGTVRAATGPRYGRIWNSEIVAALVNRFGDGLTGDFRVPGEFGRAVEVTKANTTLYASDRDMFVFLADENNRIDMKDRRNGSGGSLARGFYVWNSEVGSASMGAAFFLFDYVCRNRIIWGVREFKEMRLRHTASAPDRWLEEIAPVLVEYQNASAQPVEATILAAQQKRVDDDLDAFLKSRFSATQATAIKAAHEREEGRPIETLWDAVTAVTAHAKTIGFQNERVDLERAGGKLLDLAA